MRPMMVHLRYISFHQDEYAVIFTGNTQAEYEILKSFVALNNTFDKGCMIKNRRALHQLVTGAKCPLYTYVFPPSRCFSR